MACFGSARALRGVGEYHPTGLMVECVLGGKSGYCWSKADLEFSEEC